MKKVLLLCASHNDLGLIRALHKLGCYIICIGNVSGLIGEKFVDEYVPMDYSDKEAVLRLAREQSIDAVCQCCNDFGVYTAAYVAEQMGLPGYDSYETTLTLHNKDRFKEFAGKAQIKTPKAHGFVSCNEAEDWIRENGIYPLIIKPADASAGNGIHKAVDEAEAMEAVSMAFEKSRAGRIVVERFITGSQHGFCTFLVNQRVVACCSNNEYSFLNPYRVEIDTFPADNYECVKDVLIEQIEKIAGLLHLKDGIFHLQYIMDGDEPQIIEVMRRILGNMYSVPAGYLTGLDWDYWETRAKCGLSCERFPRDVFQEGYFAYKTILAERNGVIGDIRLPEAYEKYCIDFCFVKEPGDEITHYESEPVGFLFMQFAEESQMRRVLIDGYENGIVTILDRGDGGSFRDCRIG